MADRYERINELSKGVLGTVYLAEDTMLQRQVMYRHIEQNGDSDQESRDDSWRKEFAQYAGKIGAIQHPNMLAIYDMAAKDNDAHVVTQFVEGETLAERLERGALGQIGVYQMALDMLEVIHAAHEADVFHGALHTESIRRTHRASGGHRYLLVDLGLNKLTSLVKGEKVKVADPVLMAPELYDNDKEPDAKADLFMLGQLCYTALVGGHPFSDKSSEECVAAYNGQGVPALEQYVEGLDPHFSAWVMSLIDGDPEKRPVDSGEAMVKLYAIQLAESEPNVPGKTHAVVAQYVAPASEPNILTSSHPVQMATTASVNIEAAPTAATGHVAVGGVPSVDSVVKEKKGKTAIIYVVSGLVVALMIGIMVVAFRGDEEDEKSEVGTAEATMEENAKKSEVGTAATVFADNFDSNALGTNLEISGEGRGVGASLPSISFSGGQLLAGAAGAGDLGRIYVGTVDTNYAGPTVTSFVAEVSITINNGDTNADSVFFGLGSGTPGGNFDEPQGAPAAFFGVRDDNADAGNGESLFGDLNASGVGSAGRQTFANGDTGAGTHRFRLSYDAVAGTLEFSQQINETGAFVFASSLDVSDNGFDDTNSRIFFGGSNEATFDNFEVVSVTTIPEP